MSRKARLIPPGYLECKGIIKRLEIFKNLVLHYCPLADYDKYYTTPLKKLISGDFSEEMIFSKIKERISRLIPLVSDDLFYGKINVNILSTRSKLGKKVVKVFDIISDIYKYLNGASSRSYDVVTDTLNQGIGYYENAKRRAFWELFNPISWIAFILRIPLLVIQKTVGEFSDEEVASKFLKFYVWLLRIIILAVLAFLAAKLGISIPWHILFK